MFRPWKEAESSSGVWNTGREGSTWQKILSKKSVEQRTVHFGRSLKHSRKYEFPIMSQARQVDKVQVNKMDSVLNTYIVKLMWNLPEHAVILLADNDFKARGLSSFHCLLCLLKFVPKYKSNVKSKFTLYDNIILAHCLRWKQSYNKLWSSHFALSQGVTNRWNRWSENQSINRWQSMPC